MDKSVETKFWKPSFLQEKRAYGLVWLPGSLILMCLDYILMRQESWPIEIEERLAPQKLKAGSVQQYSDLQMKIHWIHEMIFTFVIKACKCTIPTQYQIWTKNSPIFLILKTNNNKTITKMWNLKLWIATNTNSNKIIGIFAKRGPIYCSQ